MLALFKPLDWGLPLWHAPHSKWAGIWREPRERRRSEGHAGRLLQVVAAHAYGMFVSVRGRLPTASK